MLYANYTYIANINGYFANNTEKFESEFMHIAKCEVLGHVRFTLRGLAIYELMYLCSRSGDQSAPKYYRLDWFECEDGNATWEDINLLEIEASDMDEDERYYTVVYDVKEICTETPEIDDFLIMHDELNIRGLFWEYIRNLYAEVHWRQDYQPEIPNYVSGFLHNITIDEGDQCGAIDERNMIPLLSAMIYSHGISRVVDLLDITPNQTILLDVADESAPLFAFWFMLDGPIRKKIWDLFDLIDEYYDENYRILVNGPLRGGKNLLQHILEEGRAENPANMEELCDFISEVRDPEWLPKCYGCDSPIVYNISCDYCHEISKCSSNWCRECSITYLYYGKSMCIQCVEELCLADNICYCADCYLFINMNELSAHAVSEMRTQHSIIDNAKLMFFEFNKTHRPVNPTSVSTNCIATHYLMQG